MEGAGVFGSILAEDHTAGAGAFRLAQAGTLLPTRPRPLIPSRIGIRRWTSHRTKKRWSVMPRIDAHLHVFTKACRSFRGRRMSFGPRSGKNPVEKLLAEMDAHQIDQAVLYNIPVYRLRIMPISCTASELTQTAFWASDSYLPIFPTLNPTWTP